MRRSLKFIGVALILAAFLAGCAGWQTAKGRTETMVISYESIGLIAFPTVLAYVQEREKNGTLAGDALIRSKAVYAQAKKSYIMAGDQMISTVQGTGGGIPPATIAALLRQVAIALADLSGGKVEGQTLTVGKAGGAK
jgi:hypothetical protein